MTMKNLEIVKDLKDLAQLDIDACEAYKQALKHIQEEEIYEAIKGFRDDHVQHVEDLSTFIIRFGDHPPAFTQDFKGYLIEGFTALRSLTGTEGALKAMRMNEVLTNTTYKKALSWDLPEEIKAVIEKNYDDEKRHIQYIESTLRSFKDYSSERPAESPRPQA